MIILIDSREQKPLDFPYPYVTNTEIRGLKVGDYGAEYKDGYIPSIFFERKSLSDLFGTLGGGYKRFKREIERAKKLNIKLIILVEGSLKKVLRGDEHSSLTGISVFRKLLTLWIKYNLSFVFIPTREEMAFFIYEYYCSLGKLKGKRKVA